ncbi:MAG: hypothetical protein J0L99_01670 [Chitinophagales bacterium]|nr:hypothetical protein [Chitinophagales bacterium]
MEQEEQELTLKDLILRVREYAQEIRRYWWIVVLTCIPTIGWQAYLAYTTPVQYNAGLTFMVDEESSSGAGMLGALLGDFGLPGGENNYDKILELSKSQRIIRMALFQKVEIDGKNDYLANHFIRIQKVHEEEWYKKPKDPTQPSLNGFFFTRDSFENFSRLEYAAFKSVYGMLVGDKEHKPLFSNKYNPDSGIMSLMLVTRSEQLSITLIESIFNDLSDYYILSSTIKEKATYDIIQGKADSLYRLMVGSEIGQARFQDKTLGLIKAEDQLPAERFSRNKALFGLMYGEALKNLEIADYAVKDRMPYVQVIDHPIPPLSGFAYSKKKALGFGIGLGILFGLIIIFGRKIIKGVFVKL